MSLSRVSVGGYTFWANDVSISGSGSITLGNTLTSGYSLVVVLNPSTLNIVNTYKVPAGSSVSINLSSGNYLVINMIPTQYNATEANALNLAQNPQYYPFAWSFDPAAQVYYISLAQVTQNATINLNATAYPLLLNVTVYAPSGAVNSSTVNMTGPTQLVVPLYSNVTINVVSIPRGYNLNYTQWTVNFTSVAGTVNYTYYLLPIIPINVTFLSLCPSYTLTIFNTFNGTTSTLQLGFKNTVVLYYNMQDTYSVTSYSSICKAVGALGGAVTPLLNGQFVVIPLVNPNATVVPWYGYSIPQQYLSKMLSAPLGSQLLILPPPPKTVDYYQAIPIVPLPWSNAYGFVDADLGEFFNGYVTTQENGVFYISNSATNGLYLFPNVPGTAGTDFLIYNTSGFPLPLTSPSLEVPYYVPAQMSITYKAATPITIPISVGNFNINMTISVIGGAVSSCKIPSGATLIYSNSSFGSNYYLYKLGNEFYECFLNVLCSPTSTCNFQANDTVSVTATLTNVVGSYKPVQFTLNKTLPLYMSLSSNIIEYPVGSIYITANVMATNTTVSVNGIIKIHLVRISGGLDWDNFIIPISITASVANLSTPQAVSAGFTNIGGSASTTLSVTNDTLNTAPISCYLNSTGSITRCVPWAMGAVSLTTSGTTQAVESIYPYTIAPGFNTIAIPEYNVTINAFVGGPWGWVWQPSAPPGTEGFGLISGGFPYPYMYMNRLSCTYPNCVPTGLNVPILPFYVSNWTVVNIVPNVYGTVVVPTAFGNSPNSAITATYTTSVSPSLSNLAAMQVGETVQGLFNGTFTATYKYGPYTYVVQLTATPTSVSYIRLQSPSASPYNFYLLIKTPSGAVPTLLSSPYSVNYALVLNETVTATRELLVNGEVVLMNTTRLTLTNIPFPYSSFPFIYFTNTNYGNVYLGVPPVVYELPQAALYLLGFKLFQLSDVEPLMADSEILGGNYGTLQVTYQLTEYPITITLNRTLIYSWYQGPNLYNYTVTQYLFPAVLITPSIYALTNATTQPINTYYAVGYTGIYSTGSLTSNIVGPMASWEQPNTTNYALSLLVAQDTLSGTAMALTGDWYSAVLEYARVTSLPVTYLNALAAPLIGLYTPLHDYPLPLMVPPTTSTLPSIPVFTASYIGYEGDLGNVFVPPASPFSTVFYDLLDSLCNYYNICSFSFLDFEHNDTEQWANNGLYALPLGFYNIKAVMNISSDNPQGVLNLTVGILSSYPYIGINGTEILGNTTYINYTILMQGSSIYGGLQGPANITVTQLNGTDLICVESNPLSQVTPVYWYPMNISEVVPSLDVGVYYVLGKPAGGFYVPLLQVVNVTNLCFVPTLNGTYFIVAYMPPQSLLKSVYLKLPVSHISVLWYGYPIVTIGSIINTSSTIYTPVLIVLTNTSFAMDYNDVVNPMSTDVLWLNIVQPQYVTVTTNLTAIKLLFPNATITPFSVNVTSNGTLTSSGTGVIIVNASSTSPTPITYSGGASLSIMQMQFVSTYFAGVTAKVVLNTVGTDLTPLVARLGLPLFSVNGTASMSPIAVLALPKANNTIRICIPPVIGPIVVVNSGCFNATITANETLPLVIYVRLPVNLNITAINNNGKLVVKVVGTDFFGNAVVYYPINVTVYLSNGTATYTAVIENGIAEVSTGLPYQSNTLVTAQGNGTGAYLPASASTYVPVTSVSTLPLWLAYIGSIWWLLLLVILLIVLIVIMIILERKRAKKRRVRAYTPYWV
jgi:hypothetical protein